MCDDCIGIVVFHLLDGLIPPPCNKFAVHIIIPKGATILTPAEQNTRYSSHLVRTEHLQKKNTGDIIVRTVQVVFITTMSSHL